MKIQGHNLSSERGFSLVTVMIAVVLVSVAMLALSGTTVYVLSLQTESNVRSAAVSIAADYMEEVKTRDITALQSEAPVYLTGAGSVVGASPVTGSEFVRTLTVGPGPADRSKLVTVMVQYPRGRAKMGKVELVTIIYEGVGG